MTKAEEIIELIGKDHNLFLEVVAKYADTEGINKLSFQKLKKGNIKLTVVSNIGFINDWPTDIFKEDK